MYWEFSQSFQNFTSYEPKFILSYRCLTIINFPTATLRDFPHLFLPETSVLQPREWLWEQLFLFPKSINSWCINRQRCPQNSGYHRKSNRWLSLLLCPKSQGITTGITHDFIGRRQIGPRGQLPPPWEEMNMVTEVGFHS